MPQSVLASSPATDAMGYAGDLTLATNVKDLEAAIAWYADVLGFELLYKVDEIRWAEMKSPVLGVQLGLGEQAEPKVTGNTPVWGVADVEASRSYLESRGVRFDGETMTIDGLVKLATFFDPDANPYMLSQDLSQHPSQDQSGSA